MPKNNRQKLKFERQPGSVFVRPIEIPKHAELARQRAGIRTEAPKPDYPIETPPKQAKPAKQGECPIKQSIKKRLKTHPTRPIDIQKAAKHFNVPTEQIEEILDEVTR